MVQAPLQTLCARDEIGQALSGFLLDATDRVSTHDKSSALGLHRLHNAGNLFQMWPLMLSQPLRIKKHSSFEWLARPRHSDRP